MAHINQNYLKLPGSYLFSEVNRRITAYSASHPGAKIIRLSIGDVTRPLAPAVIEAMHQAVTEMGTFEGFHGYGPEQGYDFLREAIAQHDYAARGVDIKPEEIFVSDGAKSDCGNIGDIFGLDNVVAVCDPVYPVYVDTNAMAGRAGDYQEELGRWNKLVYMPCVAENGTVYLSFQLEGERGLWYAALVDLSLFYRQVAGGLTTSPRDQILLLDAGGQVLLRQTGQEIRVELAADGLAGEPGLGFLLQCQREGQEGACFYEAEGYTARMAVIPAAGNNGIFAVGVSEDFDQVSRPIRRSALLLTTGGGLVIAGVLLLAGLNLRSGRRNERAQRELALLQEKNAAMEALNRKNQELAHHDRLQTIGTLTSSIAHEFNNLLTPIMGYSILVLEQLPSDAEELYDNVLEIYNSSRKAKEIIARLSDLSRKNTSLTFQYVSPDELVRKVLAVASPARPPHVEVRTDLACRHLWLRGNEIQLSQMLLNLILNAYHAMEPGGGTLTVATRPEGEFLCFQVSDTGSGISPEVLPHIFEPFFTTKERGKGTGLGLAIVRQVMEEHKGTITIDTAPGRGTTMLLRFPTITPPEEDT